MDDRGHAPDLMSVATRVELIGHGMHCEACGALLEEALAEEPGIASVRVTRDPDRVDVAFDSEATDLGRIAVVVGALGYAATPTS